MAFASAARTHVGRRRQINEDALLCRPDAGLWAVADGMGGHEAGDVASGTVVDHLEACAGAADLIARAEAVRRRLGHANAMLVSMGQARPRPRTIGATVVALVADETRFQCLWAGDSRAYLARGGALRQLTRDHSLVQALIDAGELDPAAAHAHPSAHVVTRAIGAQPDLKLDELAGEVRPGDTFLLASDGLTRLATEAELLVALEAHDLDSAAERLVQTCLDRGIPDDVSVVIARA